MEFPRWLALALVSPACWAVVHVLDAHCVARVFSRPWVGVATSGLTMSAALPLLAVGVPLVGPAPVSAEWVGLCLAAGALFMVSQWLYFESLAVSEAGIVAAYWNMIPLFLPVAAYLLLGEVLTPAQYAGIGVLVAASVGFGLLDGRHGGRRVFGLMVVGAWLQAGYFLLQKRAFALAPVYPTFVLTTAGMAAAALAPLLWPTRRREFAADWPAIRKAVRLLLGIEAFNLVAVAASQSAVDLGSPSLVAAVEASVPGYTFVLSLALFALTRHFGEERAGRRLGVKLALTAVMVAGVWLVS